MNNMTMIDSLILIVSFFINVISAQYPCSCSCCLGQNCQVASIGNVYAPYCTADSCRSTCRSQYSLCSADYPYGLSSGQCLSAVIATPVNGSYSCRCDCCNTGSPTCSTLLVGYTSAYSCSSGSCSVACASTYPLICISNQYGQTIGTCLGLATASTTTTTIGPYLGNPCSCYCCNSTTTCSPYIYVGNTSATLCSTYACTYACQIRYPSICPLLTAVGQTLGQCTTYTSGATVCHCKCYGSVSSIDYDLYTSGDCVTCSGICSQYTKCVNSYQVTYTCNSSSKSQRRFFIYSLIFSSILKLLFYK
ncbi:unnamed protein product [Adineta ricciae]|uniref:Uncharacterized protein n=1 Tax=Adineta ricciae TaxID=249248 RepID=A0A814GT01_ADIRI|nr:unnamed protein product [Adineta ricciae]CAF1154395.1 unnamed protein product [Adineta ricciae]